MARAGSWKLVTVPPCVFEPVPLLSFFLFHGNSESWKVEIAITLPVLNYVSRIVKGPSNVARPPARATAWPERASLQRAPRAARHRVGAPAALFSASLEDPLSRSIVTFQKVDFLG